MAGRNSCRRTTRSPIGESNYETISVPNSKALNLQTEIQFPSSVPREDRDHLQSYLTIHGWQTRAELTRALGWSERQVRETAESLGAEIVRGQAGFKLTSQIEKRSPDFLVAVQAADAAISQGKKMIRYGLALKRKLHAMV